MTGQPDTLSAVQAGVQMFAALLAIALCLVLIKNPNHGLWEGWRESLPVAATCCPMRQLLVCACYANDYCTMLALSTQAAWLQICVQQRMFCCTPVKALTACCVMQ